MTSQRRVTDESMMSKLPYPDLGKAGGLELRDHGALGLADLRGARLLRKLDREHQRRRRPEQRGARHNHVNGLLGEGGGERERERERRDAPRRTSRPHQKK